MVPFIIGMLMKGPGYLGIKSALHLVEPVIDPQVDCQGGTKMADSLLLTTRLMFFIWVLYWVWV